MGRSALRGVACTLLGTFPAALLVGLLFRFPIPFRGYDMRFHFAVLQQRDRFLVNIPQDTPTPASATVILNAALP